MSSGNRGWDGPELLAKPVLVLGGPWTSKLADEELPGPLQLMVCGDSQLTWDLGDVNDFGTGVPTV